MAESAHLSGPPGPASSSDQRDRADRFRCAQTPVQNWKPLPSNATHTAETTPAPTAADILAAAPPLRQFPQVRERIRAEDAASSLTSTVAESLFSLGKTRDAPVEVVGRGDSTLRGHVISAIGVDRSRPPTGGGHRVRRVLLIPAYVVS